MCIKAFFFIALVLLLVANAAVAVDYIVIDDFDSYPDADALRTVWKDSLSGLIGGGSVWVNLDANFAVDGNSMQFEYSNDATPYYSETKRTYSTAQDWTYAGNGVTLMEINFFGDANNQDVYRGLDPPMYVKLSDGTKTAQVNYPDINDCIEEALHTWNIPLANFSTKGVTLSKISSIILGMGDKTKEGTEGKAPMEDGTVYFDDIILWPPRCFPEYGPVADFTDDCNVDNQDLDIMATDWLIADGDADTRNLAGELKNFPTDNSQWIVGYDGNALNFDGVDDYVHISGPYLNGKTSLSMTAWVKQTILDYWIGIVTSREAGDSTMIFISCCYSGPDGLGYCWNQIADTWKFDAGLKVPLNTWTFVAMVVDPTGCTLYMKPDGGILDSGRHVIDLPPLEQFAESFWIGRSSPDGGHFIGGIDDVRIYDYNLSFSDINDLAYQIADPNPWPVYWYKFNETSGLNAAGSGIGVSFYQPVPSIANLTDPEAEGDRAVNLRDYAMLADEWLQSKLWPLP